MKRKKKVSHPERIGSYFRMETGILIIISISGILYNVGMAAGPWFEGQLVQCLFDIISKKKLPGTMLSLAFLYIAVILCVQGSRAVKRYGVRIFANDVSWSMRHVLYHCLVNMNGQQLAKENTGSLMTKSIADVDVCAEGMRKVTTEIFDTGLVMIVYLVMLLSLDWRLTIPALLFTPPAYIIADHLKKKVTSANAAYKKSASVLNQITMDRISNAVTYRQFGMEENRGTAYESYLKDYARKSTRANIFEGSLAPLYDGIAMIGAVLILYFGSKNVAGTGWTRWNIASFTTYLACFTKLAVKTSHAAKLFNAVQKAEVSWKRIRPLMEEAVKVQEEDPFTEKNDLPPGNTLDFCHVSCGYDGQKTLKDINFTARKGQIIGITGMVASGKSMLGKTLIGLVPRQGFIKIDGRDLDSLTKKERCAAVAYMGHEPELLSATIEENVNLGDSVDSEKWLKAVLLWGEVLKMPEKEKTLIGMGGSRLSGGQQARLALARTLSHAGKILVLDDPFSSVDRKTEEEILENIRRMLPECMILLISHRLYTFPKLDGVLFLKDGFGNFGSHEEILQREAEYAALYEIQCKGEDPDEKN